MNMHTPRDKCLMVFSSDFLPGNLFFLLPSSLPASSKRSVVQKTSTRVVDFDQLNMLKGVVFLFSVFLKLNSDDFPFFQTSDRTSGSKVRHFRRRTAPMIKSGLLRPNLFCLFGQNDRQTLGPHPGDVRGDFEWRRSYYLPRNPFFLLPASLPASFEKWVKSILLPRKLTDEHANTLGQLPDGVCRWLKSHRSSLKAFGPHRLKEAQSKRVQSEFEKWVKSILLPRKLTDEHANTLGQLPDGVFK